MLVLLWIVDMTVNLVMPSASNIELLFSTIAKLLFYTLCCLPLIYLVFRELKLGFSELNSIRLGN